MGTQGYKQSDIAITLDISVRTVQRAKKKSHEHGDVEGGKKKSGPKGKIDQYIEECSNKIGSLDYGFECSLSIFTRIFDSI
jgi:transposase